MYKLVLIYATFALIWGSTTMAARTVPSHLGQNDLNRLQRVFDDAIMSNDLQAIYYSTLNIKLTDPKETTDLCSKLRTLHKDSKLNAYEKDFYLVGASKNIQCKDKLPEELLSKVYNSFKSELSSTQEIYFRVMSFKLLGVQIDEQNTAKLVKSLQDLLKKDDSIVSFGYAFNVASELGPSAAFVADRVEDAVVQADEVDGKMLQFEGGLSITALVVNGIFRVTDTFKKAAPLNAEQAVKFATYFLNRRSVQSAKGAHLLIEALKTLGTAEKIAPICIQLIGNGQLQSDNHVLNVKVVDLLGKSLTPAPQNIYGKILLKKDNTVLAEKVQFVPKSSDKTVYAAQLSNYKPTRGIYLAEINADNIYTQTLQFKVLGRIKVHSLEVGVAESDASSAVKKQSVTYPQTLPHTLKADTTQKLLLKSVLIDEGTTKVISVHQAFVRLTNTDTKEEIIFVAEQDSNKAYKFDMDVGSHGADFDYKSGEYELYLIIGDASISNSFQWHVANVQLKFSHEYETRKKQAIRSMLPEIEHLFRPPEKRPPRFVSDVFTGLCLTPLVLLFIFWVKLGINVSNFSFAPCTIGFHAGFGGILALFVVFWFNLNMFQTLRLLIPIAIFTFLCGNRVLRGIHAQRITKSPSTSNISATSS
ncbi:LOW QUALITY PROTEIN: dolichyl-diphosphooligosaccharide--protein glycosyltransferase subunit 2-like [Rhagoletis pomonella]|uniref:LOW QUALITY PROTEIN: dolichyl-diphosphooligosaccharide--protein glycosyltransferase subunit 2-like n=1 Tax=Rhagoletis pomonella TaxID=28610 RepID=UPI0017831712|nr:LOW QUALITY PROTEIN: dolichyl-diphosphooligosaccharide--protein glycosyltransferase subunit 2-like [Rhagoletis pomonella]